VSVTIGLLGDVMLGRGVAEELSRAEPADVWSPELREIASACDLLICNLECCISERGRPTDLVRDKPFFFRAPPSAVGSLEAIGAGAVSLANNHALDFGQEALADTMRHLDAAGIVAAGAGFGPAAARGGALIERSGTRVGLLSVSDHPAEFAAAEGRWGISYWDARQGLPDWLRTEVERLSGECDLVVAFPHWGPNMAVRPASWQRRLAPQLLTAGADLVAGHSAHVFHGAERIEGRVVLYDLGDALDDYAVDRRLRNDLGVLALWRPEEGSLELVGLRLDFCYTRLASGEDADWIAARLERVCDELGTAIERVAEQRFLF
jgi:poly-gamma-glutamate capsule biosynthesis protein CapA/YwtB (metallophosphatase superfamily)